MVRCSPSLFLVTALWADFLGHVVAEGDAKFSSADCTWKFIKQPISHFSRGSTGNNRFYEQRVCVYDGFWEPNVGLPVFFYTGNESPVEEYVNNTGLMWDLAPVHKALVVFAEHRYFGESVPDLDGQENCMSFLSSEEALADYASLVNQMRREWGAQNSAFIAFGGSYGGMLASWMRIQYPHAIDGAIAASAPILGFPLDDCAMDSSAQVVSFAASPAAGASERCADNLKAAYVIISDVGKTEEGRAILTKAMNLCTPLDTSPQSNVAALLAYLQTPLFDLAEGSFPFPSDYITFALTGLDAPLPPWAMQVMCDSLGHDFGVSIEGKQEEVLFSVLGKKSSSTGRVEISVDWDATESIHPYSEVELADSGALDLVNAVGQAIQVWYNVTGLEPNCINWEGGAAPNAAHGALKSRRRVNHGPQTAEGASTMHANQQPHSRYDPAPSHLQNEKSRVCSFPSSSVLDTGTAWNSLVCNEGINLMNWWAQGTGRDMYWPPNQDRNATLENQVPGSLGYCKYLAGLGLYGVPEKPDDWAFWLDTAYGGLRLDYASNIVFTNGNLDPWAPAGVPPTGTASVEASVVSVMIEMGGHHLDLFWPTENDPQSVRDVRDIERAHIAKWIEEVAAKQSLR